MKLIVYDLFCGLGGWSEGFLVEGYECIGFDIERHDYGTGGYPGQLELRDVLMIDGAEFKDAACIVASPPCQEYSYMAMPWSRAKQIASALRGKGEFPEGFTGSRSIEELNRLFNACFRIQREASAAAGRHIPMVVENVRGAQAWVGQAPANYGSFYLWGDMGMVGRRVVCVVSGKPIGGAGVAPAARGQKFNPDGTEHPSGSWFAVADSKNRGANATKVPGFRFDGSGKSFQTASVEETGVKGLGMNWSDQTQRGQDFTRIAGNHAIKNTGGSWFAIGSPGQKVTGQNPDGRKVAAYSDPRRNGGRGCQMTSPMENLGSLQHESGIKQGGDWFGAECESSASRLHGSKSPKRKMASAMITKIPFPLARYVAQSFKPKDTLCIIAGRGSGVGHTRSGPIEAHKAIDDLDW